MRLFNTISNGLYKGKLNPLQLILILTGCLILNNFSICFGQQNREEWQPTDKILDAIGVEKGMIIGEAGAGRGYLTFPLAERVGSKGKIYANDISSSVLEVIRNRAEAEEYHNIQTVTGQSDDPMFPVKNLDMSVMIYVLHEVENQVVFLSNLKSYIKNEGLLVIIERRTNENASHIPSFLNSNQVLDIAARSGFTHVRTETFLQYDNIYIFRKN